MKPKIIITSLNVLLFLITLICLKGGGDKAPIGLILYSCGLIALNLGMAINYFLSRQKNLGFFCLKAIVLIVLAVFIGVFIID